MFYYFGYGSNLSVISLQAKGVTPLSSEPAVLEGWRVVFNIPDFFAIEGGTGNIEPAPGDAVHGVLHGCRDSDLATLDRLEALGICYERIEATVVTYGGRRVRTYVYVGIADILDDRCRPSERYRNILVRGAADMQLDPAHIERLRSVHTVPRVRRPPFELPAEPSEVLTLRELAARPHCTALAGAVFDMSHARKEHAYLRRLLGGHDATLLFLKRMDTSDGNETLEDVRAGRLSAAQRDYLNEYLHEFAKEYRYAGRLTYDELAPEPRRERTSSIPPRHASWRPPPLITPRRRTMSSPAARVLVDAEAMNVRLGHENLGFLSESHGFMPREEPRRALPAEFAAWDQIAAELPSLYATLRLRRAVHDLPVLDGASVPDEDLLRAAAVLSILSHAYWYVETSPPKRLPEPLERPWAELRERLGRGPAVLTYIDLIVYNWRLVDRTRTDPMRLDNMQLLLPTVDNREERIFYLTQTEILAATSPVIGAVVHAQEAVVNDDPEALESALLTILACLHRVLHETLLNINPNPHSPTYMDPVVWAKTVAPFAVPFQQGIQGPSGTSSPIFNTLDVFFGRKRYETFLGREIKQLRDTYPPFWRQFLAALQEVNVTEYVKHTGRVQLAGLLQETFEAYAGTNGFLGRHRMKVFGYLELAFKVGRNVTIGGFQGVFRDRTWEQVDTELELARTERTGTFPATCHHARVKRVEPTDAHGSEGFADVTLDVSHTAVRYEAGDRCGILPESSEDLVARTLVALGARGDERVVLTDEWRRAIALRKGYEGATDLSVSEVLRFGKIRPVVPRVAEALHAVSQDPELERAIREQTTERWELWDLVETLASRGFDPTRLWRSDTIPGVLCRTIPPETFRMYSISSVMSGAQVAPPDELALTVGPIRYASNGEERRGTASSFLASAAEREAPVSVVIQHPPRFQLPNDPKIPIVMVAGGSGLSPFRGFLVERTRQMNGGPAWLLLSLRSRAYLEPYEEELSRACASGKLRVEVVFTREDTEARIVDDDGEPRIAYAPAPRRRIEDLLNDPSIAEPLWHLLQPAHDGGGGARLYLCGRSGFARTVIDALAELFARFQEGDEAERARGGREVLRRLMAEGRVLLEVFTDARGVDQPRRLFDVSEIVRHNDDENGFWLVIDDIVYDVTEFVHQHPGGARILRAYAGIDGTDGYRRVHEGRTEVDAMREMVEIGMVHKPDFGRARVKVHRGNREQTYAMAAIHRLWVKVLYLTVEMQNALRADHHLQNAATMRDDPLDSRCLYKLQRAVETHERFIHDHLGCLTRDPLMELWTVTRGAFLPEERAEWLESELEEIVRSDDARFCAALASELHGSIRRLAALESPPSSPRREGALEACKALEEEDARFLAELKALLRTGVRSFEEYGADMLLRGGDILVAICHQIPDLIRTYHARIARRIRDEGGLRVTEEIAFPMLQPERRRERFQSVHTNRYWDMSEDPERRVVMMKRSAVPVQSLEELVALNEQIFLRLRPDYCDWGVVVDMRQAPARNDPEFENAMRRFRQEMGTSFARLAVLIESAVGVLQVNRLARAEHDATFATQSESAAIQFASGGKTPA